MTRRKLPQKPSAAPRKTHEQYPKPPGGYRRWILDHPKSHPNELAAALNLPKDKWVRFRRSVSTIRREMELQGLLGPHPKLPVSAESLERKHRWHDQLIEHQRSEPFLSIEKRAAALSTSTATVHRTQQKFIALREWFDQWSDPKKPKPPIQPMIDLFGLPEKDIFELARKLERRSFVVLRPGRDYALIHPRRGPVNKTDRIVRLALRKPNLTYNQIARKVRTTPAVAQQIIHRAQHHPLELLPIKKPRQVQTTRKKLVSLRKNRKRN